MELKQIYAPIQEDLNKVREELKKVSHIEYKWLAEQVHYVVNETGKGLRRLLCFPARCSIIT